MEEPSPSWVAEYVASMPASYRKSYDSDAIAAHARVAAQRGSAPANVGLFASDKHPGAALCVAAHDRPGLLATISAALVLCDLDVLDADAHTRKTPARISEAVDLFWVRHTEQDGQRPPVDAESVARLRTTLVDLLEGRLDAHPSRSTGQTPRPASAGGTVVRFLTGSDGALCTLEIETADRSGLLLALSQALFKQRVQIVESEVRTLADHVQDRFQIVELDGSPIGDARRLEIQVAVLSALETPAS